MIAIKRVCDEPALDAGPRVLVDRLWPRGLSKEREHVDHWLRDVAPSDDLRRWYGHDPAKWAEFRRRYEAELSAGAAAAALDRLRVSARQGRLTRVFGARDATHSNAAVLRDLLSRMVM